MSGRLHCTAAYALALSIAAGLLAGCGGDGASETAPLGALSSTPINDGAAFEVTAGRSLRHALHSLDYVNASAEPVDVVVTMRATETLEGAPDAIVSLSLAAGNAAAYGRSHAVLGSLTMRWVECLELRAIAAPGEVLTAAASAYLAGSGALGSNGVVIQAVIYAHGHAPEEEQCS